MKVIRSSEKEWIEGQGYHKKVLLDGKLLEKPEVLVQQVIFHKGDSIPPHFHKSQTEIFFVLDSGSITINEEYIEVGKGDIVVCEPGEIHGMPKIKTEFSFLVLKIDYQEDDTVWL